MASSGLVVRVLRLKIPGVSPASMADIFRGGCFSCCREFFNSRTRPTSPVIYSSVNMLSLYCLSVLVHFKLSVGSVSWEAQNRYCRRYCKAFLIFYFETVDTCNVVHKVMGCDQKSFMLVWRCDNLLSRFLANYHQPEFDVSHVCRAMITAMNWNREVCKDLLAFTFRTRKTPQNLI